MKLKILHVEDDVDIQEISRMALALSDEFELRQCSSGKEALDLAPTFVPDILLLDVMMPEMSGDELLADLRKFEGYADLPAIFMTARAQHSEREALLKAGGIAVIVKPFDPMSLAQEIKDAVARA